jgi:hypothetical protein
MVKPKVRGCHPNRRPLGQDLRPQSQGSDSALEIGLPALLTFTGPFGLQIVAAGRGLIRDFSLAAG